LRVSLNLNSALKVLSFSDELGELMEKVLNVHFAAEYTHKPADDGGSFRLRYPCQGRGNVREVPAKVHRQTMGAQNGEEFLEGSYDLAVAPPERTQHDAESG
jgi:hypothetical protein